MDGQPDDKERIIAYLSYLRDVSRRIGLGVNSGFENCFLSKKYEYAMQFDKLPENIWDKTKGMSALQKGYGADSRRNLKNILGKDALYYYKVLKFFGALKKLHSEKLFAGFGTLAGHKGRRFAAPVVFLECELSSEDNLATFTIAPNLVTLRLNYDLISALANFNNEGAYDANTRHTKRIIEEFENQIEAIIEKNVFNSNSLSEFAKQIFDKFNAEVSQFTGIKYYKQEYEFETELAKLGKQNRAQTLSLGNSVFDKESPLVFIESNHLFINKVPSILSTYEALNTFVKSIENGDFKNPVVEKMLLNALTDNSRLEFKKQDLYDEVSKIIETSCPLPLSAQQKQGIINAWENEVSYIQGPPGTGKSHTIAAIILTAQAMGKKVLVLSQKPAALKVVQEKIEPYLSGDPKNKKYDVKGICYYDRDSRLDLRGYCGNLINGGDNLQLNDARLNDSNIYSVNNSIRNYKNELNSLYSELSIKENELKNSLSAMQKHFNNNEKLNTAINAFNKKYKSYDFTLSEGYKFKKIHYELYQKHILQIKKICNASVHTLSTNLYRHKIFNHLKEVYLLDIVKIKTIQLDTFFEDFLHLNDLFTQSQNSEAEAKKRDIHLCRADIAATNDKIKSIQKQLILLQTELNIREKASRDSNGYKELKKLYDMLYNVNTRIIDSKMREINYHTILDIMPFWAAEIRNLGHLFPLEPDLFDLVVVDESSQVNLAEIIPAFYRGKQICVLGDHKQLSLEAAGLNFALNETTDTNVWDKYIKYMLYSAGIERKLVVKHASILDFLRSPAYKLKTDLEEIMLVEHFRSLPALARWTSNQFYSDGNTAGLKIMTETPENIAVKCFETVKTNGSRDSNKNIIEEEALKVIEIIRALTTKNEPSEFNLPEHIPQNFTIGVISMLRDQVEYIKDLADENFSDNLKDYGLDPTANEGFGTPEEFQGNERDIIIFSMCIDSESKSWAHVQNPQRLNVATSRARKFTYLVYSEFGSGYNTIHAYINHINGTLGLPIVAVKNYESDFERYVGFYLEQYIKKTNCKITLHSQFEVIAKMRLDFVLYNEDTRKSAAIEVDGRQHFNGQSPDDYTLAHIQRMDILTRAGWNIINTPYYKWWNGGWLCDKNDSEWQKELDRIYSELDKYLLCEVDL